MIFDVGNVLIRWDARLLYRQLLPDEAAIDAFLAEIDFHDWNLELDRGADWDEGVAALSARHPHRAELIRAFHDRWHETVPGAIDGSVAILDDLAAAGVPLYAITNFSAAKWAETRRRASRSSAPRFRDVVVSGREGVLKPDPAIYRLCLDRNGLDAAGLRLRRRQPANVAGAAALGIDAIRFTDPEALRADLARRGLLSPSGCRLTQPEAAVAALAEAADLGDRHRLGERAARRPAPAPPRPPPGRSPATGPVSVMWKRNRSST